MRSNGASDRSASAASEAAPSPSSGAIAATAAVAASASSSTCRSRSRRARSRASSSARHPLGRLDERLQLCEPECDRVRVARELLVASTCRDERGPCDARLAAPLELLVPAERVEHVELEGRARKPTLLELTRHRDQPLRRRRDVLARDRPAPCVCARAPVAEDAARDARVRPRPPAGAPRAPSRRPRRRIRPERRALLRRTPRIRRNRRTQHLRAHPGGARSPGRRSSSPRPVSPVTAFRPGPNVEVCLADEDEVLDPQATKHNRKDVRKRLQPTKRLYTRVLPALTPQ